MKTTLELPENLMRAVKVRAAASDRKLKDMIEELIRRGLEATERDEDLNPVEALRTRLRFHADGTVTNPVGIDDEAFFHALDEIRNAGRKEIPRDPFV